MTEPAPAPTAALEPTPAQMVEALHVAFGEHHARAVHAKGVLAMGVFEPSAQAARLCSASVFRGGAIPALFRFSDFTGIPDIPDPSAGASPRGFAMKLGVPGPGVFDVVSHSFNGFPTATSEAFRELLLAIGASGPGAASPTALDRFLASHPVAKTFLTTQKPPPESYGTIAYFGVNAFWCEGPDGARAAIRYRFIPVDGERFLSSEALSRQGPDYLQEELPRRLAKAPIHYRWLAQIAEPGDDLEDPSTAWPESRSLVELGRLIIAGLPTDPAALDRDTVFLPLRTPEEIVSADPMLQLREQAYPISFEARQ